MNMAAEEEEAQLSRLSMDDGWQQMGGDPDDHDLREREAKLDAREKKIAEREKTQAKREKHAAEELKERYAEELEKLRERESALKERERAAEERAKKAAADLKATVGAELRKTEKERERARSAIKEHELGAKLLLRAHAERDGALRARERALLQRERACGVTKGGPEVVAGWN